MTSDHNIATATPLWSGSDQDENFIDAVQPTEADSKKHHHRQEENDTATSPASLASPSPSGKRFPTKKGNPFIRTQFQRQEVTIDGRQYIKYTCIHCDQTMQWRHENASRLTEHIQRCKQAPYTAKRTSLMHTQKGRKHETMSKDGLDDDTNSHSNKKAKMDEKTFAILNISQWIRKTIGFLVVQQDIEEYAEIFFRLGLQSGDQIDACLSAEAFEEEETFQANMKKFHYNCILKKLKERGASS